MNKMILLKIFSVFFVFFAVYYFASRKQKKAALTVLLIFGLGCFIYVDAKYIEPNWIAIDPLVIRSEKFSEDLSKLKIVQISDLHIEKFGFRERSLIKKVNALKPDLLLITGDFLSSADGLVPVKAVLSQLHASKGIYGILGNTDFYMFNRRDTHILKTTLENSGVRILTNENVRIPVNDKEGLWLIGLENVFYDPATLRRAYSGIDMSEPKILLAHAQSVMEQNEVSDEGTDLVLVGDTHGGQVGLAILRSFSAYASRYKYVSGLFYFEGVPMYVNRGIGMKERNIRFFCRPEITVIKLLKK